MEIHDIQQRFSRTVVEKWRSSSSRESERSGCRHSWCRAVPGGTLQCVQYATVCDARPVLGRRQLRANHEYEFCPIARCSSPCSISSETSWFRRLGVKLVVPGKNGATLRLHNITPHLWQMLIRRVQQD